MRRQDVLSNMVIRLVMTDQTSEKATTMIVQMP
jgi:hypothetical protein